MDTELNQKVNEGHLTDNTAHQSLFDEKINKTDIIPKTQGGFGQDVSAFFNPANNGKVLGINTYGNAEAVELPSGDGGVSMGQVNTAIDAHNSSIDSHTDIRAEINGLAVMVSVPDTARLQNMGSNSTTGKFNINRYFSPAAAGELYFIVTTSATNILWYQAAVRCLEVASRTAITGTLVGSLYSYMPPVDAALPTDPNGPENVIPNEGLLLRVPVEPGKTYLLTGFVKVPQGRGVGGRYFFIPGKAVQDKYFIRAYIAYSGNSNPDFNYETDFDSYIQGSAEIVVEKGSGNALCVFTLDSVSITPPHGADIPFPSEGVFGTFYTDLPDNFFPGANLIIPIVGSINGLVGEFFFDADNKIYGIRIKDPRAVTDPDTGSPLIGNDFFTVRWNTRNI